MNNVIFDIRTTSFAQRTLAKLTNVPISIWKTYLNREREYQVTDDLIADVIDTHGRWPMSYESWEFVYFHITTSADRCASIKKNGLLDLQKTYSCPDSELRSFLDGHGILIDLDAQTLTYHNKVYDISYGACPRQDTEAYKRWAIGRKFYFDYTTCGFLSVWERTAYGGNVHRRPEILSDIEDLLGVDLSNEWMDMHDPYEIVARVSGKNIVYSYDDDDSDKNKILSYLTKAYNTAFGEPFEEVILIKNHIQIAPSSIIEIKPLEHWLSIY